MNETRPNLLSSDTEKNTLLNSVLQQLLIIITIQLYSVIAKNSNKRLKLSVAQCLRSYFVLLRGRALPLFSLYDFSSFTHKLVVAKLTDEVLM